MRAVAYRGVGEFVPFYALYALLFADHGLSTAQISALFVVWSVTGFVLEVPSGAWADTVSRPLLLVLAALLLALGFLCWTVFPGLPGFAAGFVLWGVSGALQSGTFEALLYDELDARERASDYARILGYATATAEAASLLAILAAAPLFAWGGYQLVGYTSVAAAVGQALLAATLPAAPKAVSAEPADGTPSRALQHYLTALRVGVAEVLEVRTVRRGVLLAATLFGFTALDEYFGLLAQDAGSTTVTVPLLVGLTVAGSLTGSALAGRTRRMRGRTMASALLLAGVLLAVGSAVGGPGVMGALGFAAIGAGYGIVTNTTVVTEARLQDVIAGSSRATVTSAAGLLSECVALALFGAMALGSMWLSTSATLVVLSLPVLAVAVMAPRWLPSNARRLDPRNATTRAP